MNYLSIYTKIIEKATQLKRKKSKASYFERHHILPKCVGGENSSTNLVLLTAKEHFVCHHLLTKIYDSPKLKFAFWAMCNQLSGDCQRFHKISSIIYEKAKTEFAKVNSVVHKGKKMPLSHIQRSSERLKNNNPHKPGPLSHRYGIPRTKETLAKISQTKKLNPEKSPSFKGYYITPHGRFQTAPQAAAATGMSPTLIRRRCFNPDLVISNHHVKCTVGSADLNEDHLGKTFRELGWDFLPAPSKCLPSLKRSQD